MVMVMVLVLVLVLMVVMVVMVVVVVGQNTMGQNTPVKSSRQGPQSIAPAKKSAR